MSTTEDKMLVMKAHAMGEEIESVNRNCDDWDTSKEPLWNWAGWDYRIKPQLKVVYINEYEDNENCIYPTEAEAKEAATRYAIRVAIKYVEAME